MLRSKDGHAAWVNTRALELAGITGEIPDPDGGEIERDPRTGEPTGILFESAMKLVGEHVPPPLPAEEIPLFRQAMANAHAVGLTGVHDMDSEPFAPVVRTAQLLRERGELTLRFCVQLYPRYLEEAIALGVRSGLGDEWIRWGGLKLLSDGAMGSRTAYMSEPFEGSEGRGILIWPAERLRATVRRAAECGIASVIHAIGDLACAQAIDVLEELGREGVGTGLRHRIEHAQIIRDEDCTRLGRLGVVASVQPIHLRDEIALTERHLGARSRWVYPFRKLLAAGCPSSTSRSRAARSRAT